MTAATWRGIRRTLTALAIIGAYILGRTDGDELSGFAYLIGFAIVATLCAIFWALGWDHRGDQELADRRSEQWIRDAGERHRSEQGHASAPLAGVIAGLCTLLVFAYTGYTVGPW